jgi:CRP/FNR family cyclic AMP-dependent transcriptional regulator
VPDALPLNKLAVFGGLSEDECTLVRGFLEERSYEAGATVVEEGTPGRELYVIDEGRADVLKSAPDGRDVKIAELGPGACFGEMALVGIMRRSATVRSRSTLRALVLPYTQVAKLAHEHPQTFTMLVMNLAREVCRRLQQADAVLGEFGPISPPSR